MHTYDGWSQREQSTFHDVLTEQLRSTPWLLMSLGIHVVIAIFLGMFTTVNPVARVVPVVTVKDAEVVQDDDLTQDRADEDVQPDVVDKPKDPVPTTDPIDPVPQTAAESPSEELYQDDSVRNDRPFDGDLGRNTSIGIGGGAEGAFGLRGKGGLHPGGGVGRKKARDIAGRGLEWLSTHQSPDGRWDCDDFMRNGDASRGPLCDGKGGATHDPGVTGLALLAFLGAGHTHRTGEYRDAVRAGLKWLKGRQDADGCFASRSDPHHTYSHAIAALAMAEAYGMTRSGVWKASAQGGIDYVMKSQNPYKAWRYGERPGDNDVSVTGWMVMALKSAKMSGLDVNDTSLQWAHSFVREMTDDETGRVGYTQRGERPVRAQGRQEQFPAEHSESLTAVGVLTRIFCGEDPVESSPIKAGSELMIQRLPSWDPKAGKVDMYYWYYASLALFQVGGRSWATWNKAMEKAIIDPQRDDGNFAGSWDPVGPWGEDGGRVYATALMTLCLEVYYRYPRVFGLK